MAAHTPTTATVILPVQPDQPQSGWPAWLREMAGTVNHLGTTLNNIGAGGGVPGPPGPAGPAGPAGPTGPAGPPDSAPISVTGSMTLPGVTRASVNINNGTGALITITLPAATSDQTYRLKDVAGNASTYPIRIVPTAGTIDGGADYYMFSDYQAAELYWTGGLWGVR